MQQRELDSLHDVLNACLAIQDFTRGATLQQYAVDLLLRSAVERQFMIVGEAFVRLRDMDDEWMDRVADARRIIGFRNVLVHGYDIISDDRVWDAVQTNIPQLIKDVKRILSL
jgi:uncharacterized protein with HEPN domain